jgi:hypothetical protein
MAAMSTRYRCPVTPDKCPSSPRRGFCRYHEWEQLVPERVYLTSESDDTTRPVGVGAGSDTPAAPTPPEAEAQPSPRQPSPRQSPPRQSTPRQATPRQADPGLVAVTPNLALVLLGALIPVRGAAEGRTRLGRDARDCAHVPGLARLDQISREHAELYWHAGQLYVTDLGSSNGTFVDGERIIRPAQLWPGVHRLELAQPPEAVEVTVVELDEYGAPR